MKHKDGKVWLHTSDYGYMDKEAEYITVVELRE